MPSCIFPLESSTPLACEPKPVLPAPVSLQWQEARAFRALRHILTTSVSCTTNGKVMALKIQEEFPGTKSRWVGGGCEGYTLSSVSKKLVGYAYKIYCANSHKHNCRAKLRSNEVYLTFRFSANTICVIFQQDAPNYLK